MTATAILREVFKMDDDWILEKQDDGFSTITRASNIELVFNMVEEGIELGSLWYSDYLDGDK